MTILTEQKQRLESAYIITVTSSRTSVNMAKRLLNSCKQNSMQAEIWKAVDGLGNQITLPDNLKDQISMRLIHQRNTSMTNAEIACFLSHYSLWCHCISINEPVCIFEHDAVLVKPITEHPLSNTIQFLGCKSQLSGNPAKTKSVKNTNYEFMKGAHAYTIDPMIAKNLVSYVIKEGITKPLDIMLRSDMFTIYQDDIYAHETDEIADGVKLNAVTTIIGKRNPFEEPSFDYS